MVSIETTFAQEKAIADFLSEFNPHPEIVRIFEYSEFIVVEVYIGHTMIGKRSIHRQGHTMGK